MDKTKIVIWGTGVICEEFKRELLSCVEIVAYIDNDPAKQEYEGKKVYGFDTFIKERITFDHLVVASVYSNSIFEQCHTYPDRDKMIFLRPFESTEDVEDFYRNTDALKLIAPGYRPEALRESGKRMSVDPGIDVVSDCYPLYHYDYFRYRTFELVADQIRDLEGDVAEAGVYKGYFARIINSKFPEDTFYLFDTFEGFDAEEAESERAEGNCTEGFIEHFKNTSVEEVLAKMPYKNKCVIRKGLFPKTAEGLETTFKFVSVDVDFQESIYASLEYFYPRLVKSGFIFVHDYNEPNLTGVKKAVQRYEEKYGTLIKVPIADKCGTLIITK